MKTDELIIHLARSVEPVRPLPSPWVRLARWTAVALPLAVLGILIVGPRADVLTALDRPAYVALALVTLVTAVVSAASAFVLSVPGVERSRLHRAIPIVSGSLWAVGLIVLVLRGGDFFPRVLAFPVHRACIIEIAAFGLLPGWILLRMLRRAAPLQLAWSAAFVALAATALGASATQIVCPIDDPAHHLVGHFAPLVLLAIVGTLVGRPALDWLRSRAPFNR